MLNKMIIVVIAIIVFFTELCAANEKFHVVSVLECNITVPSVFKLIEQYGPNEYRYSYFDSDKQIDNYHAITIFEKEDGDYNDSLQRIERYDMQLLKEYEIKGFKVISFIQKGIHNTLLNFYIFGPESVFELLNSSYEDVETLIEQCSNNKK